MEQSGLKDERVAHIAGSERPGERPRPRLLGVSPPPRCGPRTKWPRKSGQSSFLCDRKENSSSQETKQPNEFPAAPPALPIFPNERRRRRPPPPTSFTNIGIFLHSFRPWSLNLSSGRWSLVRHPCWRRGPRSRRRCRGAASRWRSSPAACVEAGVGGGVRAKVAVVLLRVGVSSSVGAPLTSGQRPVASSSFEALGEGSGPVRACVVILKRRC